MATVPSILFEHSRLARCQTQWQFAMHLIQAQVHVCVAPPADLPCSEENLLSPQLQNDVRVRTDEDPCVSHITQHGIQNASISFAFYRIDPHQQSVAMQQLSADLIAKLIVVHHWLGSYTLGNKGSEQICESIVLRRRASPRFVIAVVE
jgi:hypothetical protein